MLSLLRHSRSGLVPRRLFSTTSRMASNTPVEDTIREKVRNTLRPSLPCYNPNLHILICPNLPDHHCFFPLQPYNPE